MKQIIEDKEGGDGVLKTVQRRKSPKLKFLKEGGEAGFKTIPKKEESKAEVFEARRSRGV